MRNILLITTLYFICSASFAEPIYQQYAQSSDKKNFIKHQINNYDYIMSIIGTEKCKDVSHVDTLVNNKKGVYLQATCYNIENYFHIFIPKLKKTEVKINSCEAAIEKFEPELHCKK